MVLTRRGAVRLAGLQIFCTLPEDLVARVVELAPAAAVHILAMVNRHCHELSKIRLEKLRKLADMPFALSSRQILGIGVPTVELHAASTRSGRVLNEPNAKILAEAISNGALANCEKLNLSWGAIGDDGMEHLSFALGSMTCLRKLYCGGNEIGDPGCVALVRNCSRSVLPHLDEIILSNNKVGDAGVQALCDAAVAGKLGKLERLRFSQVNQFGAPGVAALMKAISSGSLSSLKELELHARLATYTHGPTAWGAGDHEPDHADYTLLKELCERLGIGFHCSTA